MEQTRTEYIKHYIQSLAALAMPHLLYLILQLPHSALQILLECEHSIQLLCLLLVGLMQFLCLKVHLSTLSISVDQVHEEVVVS